MEISFSLEDYNCNIREKIPKQADAILPCPDWKEDPGD
jgi:hypothetical protein